MSVFTLKNKISTSRDDNLFRRSHSFQEIRFGSKLRARQVVVYIGFLLSTIQQKMIVFSRLKEYRLKARQVMFSDRNVL